MYMSTMYMSIYLKGPSSAKFFFSPPQKSFEFEGAKSIVDSCGECYQAGRALTVAWNYTLED